MIEHSVNEHPSLSIVIPNYNGVQLLARNLPSVIAAVDTYRGSKEIIVVDDGSRDQSVALLERDFPTIKVIIHPNNKGFAEAIHSGVAAAQGSVLLLLNSDVSLYLDCLNPLARHFANPRVFSVGPRMLNEDGSTNLHSWNSYIFKRGAMRRVLWTVAQALAKDPLCSIQSLYVSGGSLMVSKEKFLALGGFHPIFKPFYGEDVDLGIRAWRNGWISIFEPQSLVTHQGHGSIKDHFLRPYVKRIRKRNSYLVEWIHYPAGLIFTQTIPRTLFRAIGEIVLLDRVNLAGLWDALQKLPEALRVRRALNASAKISFEAALRQSNND